MTDRLPDTVNYLLLALMYLFFGRILWAVWSEVRTPAAPRGGGIFTAVDTQASDKGALSFVVVEPRQHRRYRWTVLRDRFGLIDPSHFLAMLKPSFAVCLMRCFFKQAAGLPHEIKRLSERSKLKRWHLGR